MWQTLRRMGLLYFLPLLLLAVFFHVHYQRIVAESRIAHMEVIAEHQAHTLDLFLRERLLNLSSIIDDPLFGTQWREDNWLEKALFKLRQTSDAFVDIGVVDAGGVLRAYTGPIRYSDEVNYSAEGWYQELTRSEKKSIITDIYLGFRNRPHFTIAVWRRLQGQVYVLRAALSPEHISNYLISLEGASEVHAAVVNRDGIYQVVTARTGEVLLASPFFPPQTPIRGRIENSEWDCAYAWLCETPWALVVRDAGGAGERGAFAGMPSNLLLPTLAVFLLMGFVIVFRARTLVGRQIAMEQEKAALSGQLVQAAKLASVGELAAGIAHEINNPLAIIAEEVGLMKDQLDPALADEQDDAPLEEHLSIIHDAVFRCRDITRKLLNFVRKTTPQLEWIDVHGLLDDVLEGMLGNELTLGNVKAIKFYDACVSTIKTDRSQLTQVFVNLCKNAIDAMSKGGELTVRTRNDEERVIVSFQDTGCGMPPEHLEKVFMPFFTTKAPGKGTGLGLSISLTIIESLGGRMYVESEVGRGSTFLMELPCVMNGGAQPAAQQGNGDAADAG